MAVEQSGARSTYCYTRGMTPVGQSYLLFQLQHIDSQGDEILRRIQELNSELQEREEEEAASRAMLQYHEALGSQQRELRDLELELGTVQEKLTNEERRLYAGRGGSRELQALQQEVDGLKAHVSGLEDAVLVAMEGGEEAEAAAAGAAQRAAAVQAEGDRNREALGQRKAEHEARLHQLQRDRSAITAQAAPATLALYDRLRLRAGGVAVVEVAQSRCQGCRLTLPSHTIQQARQAAGIQQCPNCQRVLYIAL